MECDRPHSGPVADIMRKTQDAYHYSIRHVRKMEGNVVSVLLIEC